MTIAHLHLLLNHVPTVGGASALVLLLVSQIRGGDALRRVSLEAVYVIALMTIPAYVTGVSARPLLIDRPDIVQPLMDTHHDAALLAFLLIQVAGGAAWWALWRFRRTDEWTTGLISATFLSLAMALAASGYAANLGGKIRHPEIVLGATDIYRLGESTAPGWLSARGVSNLVAQHELLWPAGETLHFVGLWLIFGVILAVNLSMTGLGPAVPYRDVHRLLPLAAAGFAINTVTGMVFLVSMPHQYAENVSFLWKIIFLLIAGISLLYATVFEGPWHMEASRDVPSRVRLAGLSGLLAWIAVMYFGRMLPYIGNAF